jgi:hypothetical protein
MLFNTTRNNKIQKGEREREKERKKMQKMLEEESKKKRNECISKNPVYITGVTSKRDETSSNSSDRHLDKHIFKKMRSDFSADFVAKPSPHIGRDISHGQQCRIDIRNSKMQWTGSPISSDGQQALFV